MEIENFLFTSYLKICSLVNSKWNTNIETPRWNQLIVHSWITEITFIHHGSSKVSTDVNMRLSAGVCVCWDVAASVVVSTLHHWETCGGVGGGGCSQCCQAPHQGWGPGTPHRPPLDIWTQVILPCYHHLNWIPSLFILTYVATTDVEDLSIQKKIAIWYTFPKLFILHFTTLTIISPRWTPASQVNLTYVDLSLLTMS